MRAILKRLLGFAGMIWLGIVPSFVSAGCPTLLALQDGKSIPLCQYAGEPILVVNTAICCGVTSQYDGLEKLNSLRFD